MLTMTMATDTPGALGLSNRVSGIMTFLTRAAANGFAHVSTANGGATAAPTLSRAYGVGSGEGVGSGRPPKSFSFHMLSV